jgi:putative intracellular protease/amidase
LGSAAPQSRKDDVQVAFLLYDGFPALDITGPYEVLRNLPDCEPVFVAGIPGPVRNESGTLALVADASLGEATAPGIVVVPGVTCAA